MIKKLSYIIIFSLLSFIVNAANQLPRMALVIGNSAYRDMPLRNPVNDAKKLAKTLKTLGFAVDLKINADQPTLEAAIDAFETRLAKQRSVGLFFYAGHGIQARGENYLIPVNATLKKERDLRYKAVNIGRVMDALEAAGNGMNIVILDACRNNPLTRSFRSTDRGLARISRSPKGLLIAYSTSPGQVAADGDGDNSPYTAQLIKSIQVPNKHILLAFQDVANKVQKQTHGEQVPWTSSSLTQDFFFKPGKEALSLPANASGNQDSLFSLWDSVKNSDDIAQLTLFIDRYGTHPLADYARLKREQLKAKIDRDHLSPAYQADPNYPWTTVQDKLARGGFGPLMTVVPSGQFLMGADNGHMEEQPVHEVNIGQRIAVSRYEVSFAEFDEFVQSVGFISSEGPWGRGDQPVVNVSWQGAVAYAKWLSAETGHTYRLASEAEWEYAARAGSTTQYFWGDDLLQCPEVVTGEIDNLRRFKDARLAACVETMQDKIYANCLHCYSWAYQGKTVAVNTYKPNNFGLYNMLGNVAEYVQDCWRETYYGAPDDGRARLGDCHSKVVRGGHWDSSYDDMKVTSRYAVNAMMRSDKIGIRLVRELD